MDPIPTDHQVLSKDPDLQILTGPVPVVPSEVLLRDPVQVHGARELHVPPVEEAAINNPRKQQLR